MISINNISYYVGGRPLYENASLHIKDRDRIGLIGLNGKGKTTLLRLIEQTITPESGDISYSNNCTIGFLNQDLLSYKSDNSILSVALSAFKRVNELKIKINEILHQLETDYTDELIEKLGVYQEEFEKLGGYTAESQAEEVLEGIGFSTEDLKKPLHTFSGGWRMRVMLAKLLLEKPSLLMLDEPTNHLDLPSIEWIENYLKTYEGAIIIVSHDRDFINNVATSVVEVDQLNFIQYAGNYTFYLNEKELRREIQQNTFENQQKQIKQTERFIERFRAKSTKARQVQSRVKQLERMDVVEEVASADAAINFKFNLKVKSGKKVLELSNVSKSYGDNQVLKNCSVTVNRGDKIALIGANGKGKSTLLRIVSGMDKHEGTREEGHNVTFGFFAQHQLESLDVNNDILNELKQSGSGKNEQELRGVLGCFLFSGDDVFKKIKVLSGGEKSRVALAKTLISEANILLLDEPTNHLDFISENILIQAMQQYEGSFITVSHNRHFITEIANKIWYIENKELKEYPGTYHEYLYWYENNRPADVVQPIKNEIKPTEELKKEKTKTPEPQVKKLDNKIKKEIEDLENEIFELENKKSEIEEELSNISQDNENGLVIKLSKDYKIVDQKLEELSEKWEDLVSNLPQ